MEDGRDLPPYALNVFIPLDRVTEELGPTELWLKSHKESTAKEIMKVLSTSTDDNDDHTNNDPIIGPTLSRGSVLMYDYRICHRGTRNLSDTSVRPMLYLMYARPWFQEHLNFGSQRLFPTTTTTTTQE
jgi:ectoine hydroxylase-related dioxygenase (phytanoyl-CoA dioxygenase family)